MPKLGVAGGIAAIAGTVVLLCIPAVFYLEARSQEQWPVHLTQAVATLVCVGASAVFLSSRRTSEVSTTWSWLAFAAVFAGTLWILAWVVAFFVAIG